MLLGVLLAGLIGMDVSLMFSKTNAGFGEAQEASGSRPCDLDVKSDITYLRWLPNLLTNDLPLIRLVLLDGVQKCGALLFS